MQETNTNKALLDAARAVPCIEVLDSPAGESERPILTFYPGQELRLIETLEKCRREEVTIRETASGNVGLFRRVTK